MYYVELLGLFLTLLISQVMCVAQYFDMSKDTCVLSLVIPKESIKSTCSSNEGLLAKMQAMETQFNQLRRRVHIIDIQRLQPTMVKYRNMEKKIQSLENALQSALLKNTFYEGKLKSMESKLNILTEHSEKSEDNPDRLLDPIKPLLMAEFQSMKANLLESLEQEIFQRYLQNFEEIGSSDEQTAEVTVSVDHNSSVETKKLIDKNSAGLKANDKFGNEELLTVDPGNLDHFARSLKSVNPKKAYQSINEQSSSSPIVATETINDSYADPTNKTADVRNYTTDLNETVTPSVVTVTNSTPNKDNDLNFNTKQDISQKLFSMVNNAVTVATNEIHEEVDRIKREILKLRRQNPSQDNTARISNLESDFSAYQQNQTNTVQHVVDSQESFEFLTTGNFQEIRSTIDRLERRLDSPQNDLLRESKFKEELKRLKTSIQSELYERLDNSVGSLQKEIEVLDHKVNVSGSLSFINLFKQTLQSYRNESRIATGNLELKINRIRNQIHELNMSRDHEADLEMRVEDIERELNDIIMTQSFAEDKIDKIKTNQIEKDREIGTKFREVSQSVLRASNKLSAVTGLNRTLQVLEAKNSAMSNKVTKIENTIKYLYIQQKLESNQWLAYNFSYASVKNGCNKIQYIRKNTYCSREVGKFVGVVLCSEDRYKIFLGNSLDDQFLDIGDEQGRGEDHCELVGGTSEQEAKVDMSFSFFVPKEAYIKNEWGQPPRTGTVSAILAPTTSWYECGVKIP